MINEILAHAGILMFVFAICYILWDVAIKSRGNGE